MRPDASQKLKAAAPRSGPNPVVIGAVIAAVIVVGVAVAILIAVNGNTSGSTANAGSSSSAVPVGVTGGEGGGIVANAATVKSNAPTLDVYEDFQCPICGQLEKVLGPTIASMGQDGDVKLVFHTLSFLDANLKNDSSSRSANAAACAADAGKFLEYHAAVFAGQPTQEGAGYTDAQLTGFATKSGITGVALTTWQKCTSSGQHDKYVADVQTAAEKAGVNSTPTVQLNGQTLTLSTADALVAQVRAATK
jgi:protein-disulfide isomerase